MAPMTVPDWLIQPDPPPTPPPPPPDPEVEQVQSMIDATRVEALKNEFFGHEQEALHSGPEALFGLGGEAAMQAVEPVLGGLRETGNAFLERTENPRQRALLAVAIDSSLAATHGEVARHVEREMQEWRKSTAQGRIDFLARQAALEHGDPDQVASYAGAVEAAARGRAEIEGHAPGSEAAAAIVASARSSVYRSAIEGALDKGDIRSALGLFGRAEGALTPMDAKSLAPLIEGARERETAEDYVATLPMTPDDAASAGLDLLPWSPDDAASAKVRLLPMTPADAALVKIELLHEAATAKNAEDWADDDSQRATNQHLIDVRFGTQKREYMEAKAALGQATQDWLTKPGADGRPQTERPPLAIWTKLDPEQQKEADIILARNAVEPTARAAGTPEKPVAREIMSDALPEPMKEGEQYAQAGGEKPRIPPRIDPALTPLPANEPGPWKIELRYNPILHRGHAFLVLVGPDGKPRAELHGLGRSKTSGDIMSMAPDGGDLVTIDSNRPLFEPEDRKLIEVVASGSYDDIVSGKWAQGKKTAVAINEGKFDYKGHDISFEISGNGGQIQNSNSVAFTLGKAMGLNLDAAANAHGHGERFPGWKRDLTDPSYKRFVAPPDFPVTNIR